METTLYCFTGTGNSLWVARALAEELGGARVESLGEWRGGSRKVGSGIVGLVFPVYIWGVPARIVRFVEALENSHPEYVFAIAVNGGQVAGTLLELKKLLKKNNQSLSSGFGITMPSNYIPWGGPGPLEEQNRHFGLARTKIAGIARCVTGREERPVEKGPLWQRLVFTPLHKLTFSRVPKMDNKFWADEKCDHCSVCSKVCPSGNITIEAGRPSWNHRCEQCFACLQWCPKEAIQYGKKTPGYERYHHPEVHLREILKSR